MTQLVIWSAPRREWVNCPPDEILWLDRSLLSQGHDTTLHRSPRCPGVRFVHYRWELFSRDTTHRVYLAPYTTAAAGSHQAVQSAARQVLPVAPEHYETLPIRLEAGSWVISVGRWVLPLCVDVPVPGRGEPTVPLSHGQPVTQEGTRLPDVSAAAPRTPPRPDAVPRVQAFFARNETAALAVAYLYQEFVLGLPAPQAVPMVEVAIALDLSGEGAVSDYKRELQRRIWAEQRHQRELPEFLLANGLIGLPDLERAKKQAVGNDRAGRTERARERLRYRPKK
jgi:hypothetical protein